MDIRNLSQEALVSIVSSMMDTKKIELDDLVTVLVNNPTPELKRMADALHAIFCKICEASEAGENCIYLKEETLDTCWTQPRHTTILKQLLNILTQFNVQNELLFKKDLGMAIELRLKLAELSNFSNAIFTAMVRGDLISHTPLDEIISE